MTTTESVKSILIQAIGLKPEWITKVIKSVINNSFRVDVLGVTYLIKMNEDGTVKSYDKLFLLSKNN